MRVDGPVLFLFESLDFAFALDDQAEGDGLHASGGKPTADLVPEQGRDLVADQAIEHPARLLGVDQVLINLARMLESFANRPLRDLVKGHPLDAGHVAIFLFTFILIFTLTLLGRLLFLGAIVIQFVGQVGRDGLAFAIRVRGQEDVVRRLGELLQLDKYFLFAGDDDVLGIEFVFDIHAQRALGQVLHVSQRGFDGEAFAKIFLNGFRLGGRLDDD